MVKPLGGYRNDGFVLSFLILYLMVYVVTYVLCVSLTNI